MAQPAGAPDASPEPTLALARTFQVRAAGDRVLMLGQVAPPAAPHFPVNHLMERLTALLREAFPDAEAIDVVDRTGGGDHFHVTVVSPSFDGRSLVDQHKRIYAALAAPLADGTIHELRITTKGTT